MPTTITDNARLQRLRDFGMSIKESQPAHSQLKRASVLVLITQDWHILLTRRSKQLKSHPGEVCLPGGKQDPEDHQDDLVTALRETKEEVGLHLLDVMTPLCRLPTLESINHLCVTPIVVYVETPHSELALQLNINPTEVDVAFWVPLKYFSKVAPVEQYEIPWSGETFVFRRYHYCQDENGNSNNSQQYSITGLTAHIAHQVSTIA
jgi:coenzyme A diphosphatase NUDT7